MSIPRVPLSALKNQPGGIAGLDAEGRVTAPIRGRVSILDYGGDPTGVTACDSAVADAIADNLSGSGYYRAGPEIEFPAASNFRFADELNLKHTVKLVGAGSGLAGGQSTVLTFPADSRGIIVNRYNTLSNGVEAVPTTAADGAILQGLEIRGSGTNTSAHGVWLRARAIVRDCVITGFGGNGLHIVAGAGFAESEPAMEGNANNWRVDNVRCQGNGEWGVYVDGPDANAGMGIGIDCSGNGSGGIWDSSFLGNKFDSCHTATNGTQVSGKNAARNRTSLVWYGGMRYFAAHGATPQQLIDTTPGANPAVWRADVASGAASITHPEWLPGQALGRYFVSYPYRTDDPNAHTKMDSCYQEGGYSRSHFVLPTFVVGGPMGDIDGGAHLKVTYQGFSMNVPLLIETIRLSSGGISAIALDAPGDHPGGLAAMAFDAASGDWMTRHAGLAARTSVRHTTDLSAFTGGRPAAVGGGHIRFPRGAFVGQRMLDSGTAPPTTGEAGRGDMRINENAAVGQPSYWQCTTAGVNGSTAVWTAGPVL